jgi:tripartite-type tricarboxylate transporter receptor subunit TctC
MAHPGIGSFGHLCSVLFAREIGAKADQIPYRGAGPALNDLLAGHADLGCQSAAISEPLIKAGKLKAYGIIGPRRSAGLPDLPTMGEAGYKKLDLEFWHMLLAPAGTPDAVIHRVNAALRHALADAKVTDTFAKSNMELYPADAWTPEAAAALLRREINLWSDVIRTNDIPAQ